MSTADVGSEEVSQSAFYGGLLQLRQLKSGYRVAIDPVLLAASLAPDPGSVWLELGCGVGAASLCLLARCPEVEAIGVEIDPTLAMLARQNAEINGFTDRFQVIEGDAADLARINLPEISGVFVNPPFHDPSATLSPDVRRRQATHGEHLKDWIGLAARILPHHGALSLIYRADGLARALAALAAARPRFGGISILPLWPRAGQAAKRIILSARRESKAPLRLAPGLILHGDENDYSPECKAILRGPAALV